MNRMFLYALIAAVVVVGMVFGAGPIRRRFNELRSNRALISGDTGDVMSGATYQRFKASREAIAAIREDLRRIAQAESAFIADSGRPTTNLAGYANQGRGNIGPTIQIMQDRWIGSMTNSHTTAQCQVIGLLDTAGRQRGSAKVQCLGVAAVESAFAVAQREEASRAVPPAPVAPEPDQPSAPPAPRPHRDWGPVNNTPPPMPWVIKNVCPGEYCAFGRWAACSTVVTRRDKRPQAQPVFTIQPGEDFTALTGDVHVDVPGMVVFRHPYSNPGNPEGEQVDSIRFTPADTLYVLNASGEGFLTWYYRGRAANGYQFWIGDPFHPGEAEPGDTAVMIRSPQVNWWVRVRNRAGQEGWILHDYRRMAQDNRMDELSRCLR
jgi:hypothetical protein